MIRALHVFMILSPLILAACTKSSGSKSNDIEQPKHDPSSSNQTEHLGEADSNSNIDQPMPLPDLMKVDSDLDGIPDDLDCAPNDQNLWQTLDFNYVDRDLDKIFVASSGKVCSGEKLSPSYSVDNTDSNGLIDCDDENDTLQIQRNLYVDQDGDGFGTSVQEKVCSGITIVPSGYSDVNGDDDDNDPEEVESITTLLKVLE